LSTGDFYDLDIRPTTTCIVAYNDVVLQKHKNSNRMATTINFKSGATVMSATLYSLIHGILMFLAWGILISFGMTIAKYFKFLGRKWYYLHITFNLFGFLFTIVAFSLVFSQMLFSMFISHDIVSVIHSWLGLIVILGVIVQPLLGFYANWVWNPDRKKVPYFPDMTHWWLGRFLICFAIINMFFGLLLYGATFIWYILLIVWIIVLIVTQIIVYKKFGSKISVQDTVYEMVNTNVPLSLEPEEELKN